MKQFNKFYYEIDLLLKEYRNALRLAFKKVNVDISVDQWLILFSVGNDEGISQKEIADKTAKEPAAVVRMLDLMNDQDLIARIPTKEDRRKYQVILTNKGRGVYKELKGISADVQKRGLSNLDFVETQDLTAVLAKIKDNLSN